MKKITKPKVKEVLKPLKYETVEKEGEMMTRLTYPDGHIEWREL